MTKYSIATRKQCNQKGLGAEKEKKRKKKKVKKSMHVCNDCVL